MKQVTVLLDDENKNNSYLEYLGQTATFPGMCLYVSQAKIDESRIFNFNTFGLMTENKKLDDYLKTRDGIICLMEYTSVNDKSLNRMKNIAELCPNSPILFIIFSNDDKMINLNVFDKLENNNRKVFINNKFIDMHHPRGIQWFYDKIKNIAQLDLSDKYTSVTIPIKEMVTQFYDNTLPITFWDHYGRLRIVFFSILHYGYKNTIDQNGWLCTNWKKYKHSIGHGNLWNYTLTRFWTNILYCIQRRHKFKTFKELYDRFPKIHYGSLFKEFYSNDIIFSDRARKTWIPPNLPPKK